MNTTLSQVGRGQSGVAPCPHLPLVLSGDALPLRGRVPLQVSPLVLSPHFDFEACR